MTMATGGPSDTCYNQGMGCQDDREIRNIYNFEVNNTLICQIKVHKLKKMHKFMGNLDFISSSFQFYSLYGLDKYMNGKI